MNHIMIIDDNKIDCFINQKIIALTYKNITTKIFNSSFDALDYFKKIPEEFEATTFLIPDIILLDINMPVMNGFEFLKKLAKTDVFKKKAIDVYFLSSSNNEDDITNALEIEFCTGYVYKPLTQDKLHKLLERKANWKMI